jgi:hypothetical protein
MMTDDGEINELLERMMHGPNEALPSILYAYDRIGPVGQQIVRGMIERLNAFANPDGWRGCKSKNAETLGRLKW